MTCETILRKHGAKVCAAEKPVGACGLFMSRAYMDWQVATMWLADGQNGARHSTLASRIL